MEYIVQLKVTQQEDPKKRIFTDKKLAEVYRYHLKMSNFDNPYCRTVLFNEWET